MFEGWQSPFAEANRQAADRANAWEAIKGNLPALGLMAGLSMLANNNGSRSFGQLVGRAGADALGGLGNMMQAQAMQERQRRQDAERSQYNEMRLQGMQADLDERKRLEELVQRFAGGDESALKALDPVAWWKNKQAQEQQRTALANSMALAKYRAGLERQERPVYDARLGGYVRSDGSFTPVRMPEGYVTPRQMKDQADEYLPVDAAARRELGLISSLDASVDYLNDAVDKAYSRSGGGGTGLVVGALPNAISQRVNPAGVPLRSAISNFSSQIMNALSGAAVSEQERVRLEGFLPTVYDDEQTLRDKMQGYMDYVEAKGNAWKKIYGDNPAFGRMRTFSRGKADLPEGFVEVTR